VLQVIGAIIYYGGLCRGPSYGINDCGVVSSVILVKFASFFIILLWLGQLWQRIVFAMRSIFPCDEYLL
jgi:hypothetical protein